MGVDPAKSKRYRTGEIQKKCFLFPPLPRWCVWLTTDSLMIYVSYVGGEMGKQTCFVFGRAKRWVTDGEIWCNSSSFRSRHTEISWITETTSWICERKDIDYGGWTKSWGRPWISKCLGCSILSHTCTLFWCVVLLDREDGWMDGSNEEGSLTPFMYSFIFRLFYVVNMLSLAWM